MTASRSIINRFSVRELKQALPHVEGSSTREIMNPFIPRRNPATKRWAPPRYSLRRQAELIKRARLEGNVHLLPPGPKLPLAEILAAQQNEQFQRQLTKRVADNSEPISVEWLGKVKEAKTPGADVGNRLYAAKKQMFKGHKWERVIRRRRKYQRILMRDMSKRIWRWRQYRVKRKPWPLSIPRISAKDSQKLPF